jgi:hypothetical protein
MSKLKIGDKVKLKEDCALSWLNGTKLVDDMVVNGITSDHVYCETSSGVNSRYKIEHIEKSA